MNKLTIIFILFTLGLQAQEIAPVYTIITVEGDTITNREYAQYRKDKDQEAIEKHKKTTINHKETHEKLLIKASKKRRNKKILNDLSYILVPSPVRAWAKILTPDIPKDPETEKRLQAKRDARKAARKE